MPETVSDPVLDELLALERAALAVWGREDADAYLRSPADVYVTLLRPLRREPP